MPSGPMILAGGGPPPPPPPRGGGRPTTAPPGGGGVLTSLWGLGPHWPPTARRALRVRCFRALAPAGPGWGCNPQLIHPPSRAGKGAGGGAAPRCHQPLCSVQLAVGVVRRDARASARAWRHDVRHLILDGALVERALATASLTGHFTRHARG